jgi:uncharacterized protein YycO
MLSYLQIYFIFYCLVALNQPTNLQEGDIIFQTSTGKLSKAIQLATHSKYSHVGIIFKQNNQYVVLEAIQPVKITPLSEWIARGESSHYVVKRLKNSNKILNSLAIDKMKKIGRGYIGKDYDIYFAWSNERFYCSELVWKIYQQAMGIELGTLKSLKEFDLKPNVVRQKLKEHYGKNIPLEEKIISPDAIFQSDLLEIVAEQ